MDVLILAAASSTGFDTPYGVLGASAVFFAALAVVCRTVYKDVTRQRDAYQAKVDRIHETLSPTLDRILESMERDRDLIIRLNAELDAARRS